jgi:hypothetical protein
VPLPPPAAFQDLGSLVLGHHALHLQEQIILRRLAQRAGEEDDLHARALQLVDEQGLVSVLARQAIGGMDVEALDRAGGGRVAQAFESGANERGPAVALVDEGQVVHERQAVGGDLFAQGGQLARNGVGAGLLLGGDPRVDGSLQVLVHHAPALPARGRSTRPRPPAASAVRPRRRSGRTCSYAVAR